MTSANFNYLNNLEYFLISGGGANSFSLVLNSNKLEYLAISGLTLSSLDLSNIPNVDYMIITTTSGLSTLDLSNLYTFDLNCNKITEIKNYMTAIKRNKNAPKPELAPFFESKNFKQAYQCYACHKSSGLWLMIGDWWLVTGD